MKMISAQEAQAKQHKLTQNINSKEVKEVMEKITNQIRINECPNVFFYHTLKPMTLSKLRDLGYDVNVTYHKYTGYKTSISW